MTNKRIVCAAALLAATTLAVAPAALPEQSQADQSPDLAKEIRDLNRSIQDIASLLREQLKKQQADVLMKRMEISGRALSELEQELRGAVAERNSLSDGLKEVQARMDQLKDEATLGSPAGSRPPDPGLIHEGAELALRERLVKERLAAAEQRVSELENDVAKRRDEIKGWEELVDTQLGLR
jgi:hypothetical protein